MVYPLDTVVGFLMWFGRRFLETAASVVSSWALVLDPRPDLALKARDVRVPYAWWW